MRFRRFSPTDASACREIYELNEPGRFPEGHKGTFESYLSRQDCYILIGEKDGRVVALGGVHYFTRSDVAVFCYGLVHPEFQGRGVGAALVLARFSLLKPVWPGCWVLIFAVEKSIGYYRRFGFGPFPSWPDGTGKMHPAGKCLILSREIVKCRRLLAQHNISVPADEAQVPMQETAVYS